MYRVFMVTNAANRLKVLRAERGISQMDTADAAGISHNRYWRIENGYITPTDKERKALAKVLRTGEPDAFPSLPQKKGAVA